MAASKSFSTGKLDVTGTRANGLKTCQFMARRRQSNLTWSQQAPQPVTTVRGFPQASSRFGGQYGGLTVQLVNIFLYYSGVYAGIWLPATAPFPCLQFVAHVWPDPQKPGVRAPVDRLRTPTFAYSHCLVGGRLSRHRYRHQFDTPCLGGIELETGQGPSGTWHFQMSRFEMPSRVQKRSSLPMSIAPKGSVTVKELVASHKK